MTSLWTQTYFLNMAALLLLLVTSLCVEVCHSQAAPVNWGQDLYFNNRWPDPSQASLDNVMSLMDCAALCSTQPWCSSFFYLPPARRCLVFRAFYVDREVLTPRQGAQYYRIVSDTCPFEKCYYLSRPDNLCLHLDLAAQKSYTQSDSYCHSNSAQLAILDTDSKIEFIVKLLEMHNVIQDARVYLGAAKSGSAFYWCNNQVVNLTVPVADDTANCLMLETVLNVTGLKPSACDRISTVVLCEYNPNRA